LMSAIILDVKKKSCRLSEVLCRSRDAHANRCQVQC
jgi:hypothetical protein